MIDTDKYEGHYTDDFARFWVTADDELNADIERANATTNLIDDAPRLLAEVKRLQSQYEELKALYEIETRLLKKMEKQYRELKDIVRDPTDNYSHNAVKEQLKWGWKHYEDLRVLDAKHGSHATFIKQYEELKEALIGDSPNWTHDEVVQQALELATLNHNYEDEEE